MELIVRRCQDARQKYTSGAIGFYNTGQLFIEDYYTLSVLTHAGLGTKHLDGNTRLCTATASFALRETFGNDGNPASVTDYDTADCIAHFGHNVAATQTVAWMRILDRRRGPRPPKLIVVDPRRTDTAKEADVHLAPRLGTNVALMNGLLNLVIANGHLNRKFIDKHTVGFEQLQKVTANYPPERVEEITGVPAEQLRKAARILGTARRLVCTVLQGFYQANEATAASCQVNNLVLIRGMIGKPGCGVIQSNGQRLGIAEGDWVELTSSRGTVRGKAQIGDMLPRHVFISFHYGYWDEADSNHFEPDGRPRAANELTLTAWDVVSKQPTFKYAAVKMAKVGSESLASRIAGAAGEVMDRAAEYADELMGGTHLRERSHVSDYLSLLSDANEELIAACEYLSRQHQQDAEIREGAKILSSFSRQAVEKLAPFLKKYGEQSEKEPRALRQTLFPKPRAGGFGLVRDLHALHILAADAHVAAKVLKDAAHELRDDALYEVCLFVYGQNQRQLAWVDTMIKESAPQAVVVPS